MAEDIPCHITAPHGRHLWTPLVADPEAPRVLHLLGVEVPCAGVTVEEWLDAK